ncbi:hypothetical protein FH972_020991 [Carpinus fangiana]|uniref:nicotinate phosphoribosyltransferase n=1 Tax=Carpinus fangiana TaxID=176857 RepID=A0A5N6KNN4_9ROSI|nr:hypothetical protein FH972_020991 [Carpinus fangiana]
MAAPDVAPTEGVFSLLDTDLYKLTMQSAVLKYFPSTHVTYSFTNRTADMKLSREAYDWLHTQVSKLADVAITPDELAYLRTACPFLSEPYLTYLATFRFKPAEQIRLFFTAEHDTGGPDDRGNIELHTKGLWLETILYEIPLLALTSEAYFKFCDRDWDHAGQTERAHQKGRALLKAGCQADREAQAAGWTGRITGTSNVHFAMRFGVPPIGTVAHEWFMGVAAVTEDYTCATEIALRYWIGTFGRGVLAIALTDTFGTPTFLSAFKKPIEAAEPGGESFADVFTGVRQDSGDPIEFVKLMRHFYGSIDAASSSSAEQKKRTIVFSDSLNVERCIELRGVADSLGFASSFGVGTFFTNDFTTLSSRGAEKSAPLNIVIKLSSADGKPAIKISDNLGKNTGDSETVRQVKKELGYVENEWAGVDEKQRWGNGWGGPG